MGAAASTITPPNESLPVDSRSDQESVGEGLAPLEDDSKPSDGDGLTNGRLKRLALGIPGYKDQQRDYDPTLAKLDVNKHAEKAWTTPTANGHNSSGYSIDSTDSSFNSGSRRHPRGAIAVGPPPGVSVRPFPHELMAHRSAHEIVTPTGSAAGPAGAMGSMGPTGPPMGVGPPRRSAHQLSPAVSGRTAPSPIPGYGGPGPMSPMPGMSPMTPMMSPPMGIPPHSVAMGPVPVGVALTVLPGGAVAVGNMPRVGPPPNGPRGAPRPIVKETSNVKRNRIQLPDKLIHSKPTTGDWLNKRYLVNNYILLNTLGVGSYGEVRLCKDRTNEKLFAIKIISKDFLKKKKSGHSDETYFEDIKREIAIMKKLLHPNILRLFEVLDDPKVNKIYLLLEYVKRGDLINILRKRKSESSNTPLAANDESFQSLSDLEIWNIFRQLVAGIRYLHFQNIVHGDIKPQNLLLGEDEILKVADFGISQMLSGAEEKLLDAAGTPAFMAPELCEKRSFSGQAADIWAMGATVYMLRFGAPPFIAKNIIHLFSKICNDPLVFPEVIDAGLKDLLEGMLEKDPSKRLTMQQVASHAWMRAPPIPRIAVHSAPPQQPVLFAPPASYVEEEAAAMKERVIPPSGNELFMSIGMQVTYELEVDVDDDDLEDDDDDDREEAPKEKVKPDLRRPRSGEDTKAPAADDDMMHSQWGGDVFQLVEDDGESDDDVDDDDGDEDDGDAFAPKASKKEPKEKNRLVMSQEEEMRRSKQFIKKIRKSSENVRYTAKEQVSPKGSSSSTLDSPSKKKKVGSRRFSYSKDEEDDWPEELVGDDFAHLMDTLSQQPAQAHSHGRGPVCGHNIYGSNGSHGGSMHTMTTTHGTIDESIDWGMLVTKLILPPSRAVPGSSSSSGIGIAVHSEQGLRSTQEDRFSIVPLTDELVLVAIFDGHSGWRSSHFLAAQFAKVLKEQEGFGDPRKMEEIMIGTFRKVDFMLCSLLKNEEDLSGSTAIVCLLDTRRHRLTVGGVGDSLCVLSRNGQAVLMNTMHRLDLQEEKERVRQAGGMVMNNRVNGILAISRAFGDLQFKNPIPEQMDDWEDGLVISRPEVHSELMTPMTEFMLLATDGLWDILPPQEAISFVRAKLQAHRDLQQAAKELVKEALTRGSVDNVTVLIVVFGV